MCAFFFLDSLILLWSSYFFLCLFSVSFFYFKDLCDHAESTQRVITSLHCGRSTVPREIREYSPNPSILLDQHEKSGGRLSALPSE